MGTRTGTKAAATTKPATTRPAKPAAGKTAASTKGAATRSGAGAVKTTSPRASGAAKRRGAAAMAGATSAELGILGVHHVALGITDLAATRAFYGDLLGMSEDPARPDFGVAGMWYWVGQQQLHLGLVDEPPPVTGAHTAIHVRDLEAVLDRLDQAGVRFRRVPYIPGAGRQAVLRDPSGNRLELNQPEPR